MRTATSSAAELRIELSRRFAALRSKLRSPQRSAPRRRERTKGRFSALKNPVFTHVRFFSEHSSMIGLDFLGIGAEDEAKLSRQDLGPTPIVSVHFEADAYAGALSILEAAQAIAGTFVPSIYPQTISIAWTLFGERIPTHVTALDAPAERARLDQLLADRVTLAVEECVPFSVRDAKDGGRQ